MLREHAEHDLAQRAASFADDEMARIGILGAYYDLRSHHSQAEVEHFGMSREPDAREREIDRLLRAHAMERQQPS